MTDVEIRLLQVLLGNALLRVQELVGVLNADDDARETARGCLLAVELTEAAIRKSKTPLRRIIRQK